MSIRAESIRQFEQRISDKKSEIKDNHENKLKQLEQNSIREQNLRKDTNNELRLEISESYLEIVKKSSESIVNDFSYYLNSPKENSKEQELSIFRIKDISLPVFNTKRTPEDIIKQARNRMSLPYILLGRKIIKEKDFGFMLPVYYSWQKSEDLHPKNFVIDYLREYQHSANSFVNNLLIRILMAFDGKDVHFSFIDPMNTNHAAFFINHLEKIDKDIINEQVLFRTEDIHKYFENLRVKVSLAQRLLSHEYKSIVDFNEKGINENGEKRIASPYEVIVMYETPDRSLLDRIKPFIKNGYKTGIYFVILKDKNDSGNFRDYTEFINNETFANIIQKSESEFCLNESDCFYSPDYISDTNAGLSNLFSLNDTDYFKSYFSLFEERVNERKEEEKIDFNLNHYIDLFKNPAESPHSSKEISVPIGVNDKKDNNFNFVLNEKDHPHAFILGKTGSGKSVLLHDIITMSCFKYNPEELQFYLIDLKKGGVEFNIYATFGIPHAKAILLDDSDQQIVLEIFENLNNEMIKRGKEFNRIGVQNLSEYNTEMNDQPFPRIMVIVDECHKLFPENSRSFKLQQQIQNYIESIATEGRSQGIHLVLATQTLANTMIPAKIKNNMTDNYLLRCSPIDAENRVGPELAKYTKMFTQDGQAFYSGSNQHQLIQPFYLPNPKDNQQKAILEFVKEKKSDSSHLGFVFSGNQKYYLEDKYNLYRSKKPAAIVGAGIGMEFKIITAGFSDNDASNLLIVGGTEENAVRICFSSVFSLSAFYKNNNKPVNIYIINLLDEEMVNLPEGKNIFSSLENERCRILENSGEIKETLLNIQNHIKTGNRNKDIYLCIFGQHRFREIKNDVEIKSSGKTDYLTAEDHKKKILDFMSDNDPDYRLSETKDNPGSKGADFSNMDGFHDKTNTENENNTKNKRYTYKSLLQEILLEGPETGVHTIIQVDKQTNLLFEDHWSVRDTGKLFSNIVLLNMPESQRSSLIYRELKTEELSNDPERVRAFYYNDYYSDRDELITPFMIPKKEFINRIIH